MLSQVKEGYVKSEIHNGVATIEFFHPQSNSMPGKLLEELAKEIHSTGNEDEVRVIILQSAGDKAFCAGASFDELIAIKTPDQGREFFSGFAHVINEMRKCPYSSPSDFSISPLDSPMFSIGSDGSYYSIEVSI